MSLKHSLLVASLTAGLSVAAPAAFADSATPTALTVPSTSNQAPTPTPQVGDRADDSSYASRERQDKQVQNYKGGSVVVIGVSGGAVLVAVLLILILL